MLDRLEKIGQKILVHEFNYLAHRVVDLPVLLRWATLPKGLDVLEIGCGTGRTSRYLYQALRCKSYTAVDINPQRIATADANTHGNAKIIFQVADACKLPFDNQSFDAVIELDVLHQISNWKKALGEIWRVLRKNGKLLMKDYSIETFMVPGVGLILRHLLDRNYDTMYDQVELLSYVRKNGFLMTHQNDNPLMMMLVALKKPREKGA